MKKQSVGFLVGIWALTACAPADTMWEQNIKPVISGQDQLLQHGYYEDAVNAIGRHAYGTALTLLQAASLRNPSDVRVLNAYGVIYDKLGQFDVSESYYEEARALDPKSKIIANNIAYSKLLKEKIQNDGASAQSSRTDAQHRDSNLALSSDDHSSAVAVPAPVQAPTLLPNENGSARYYSGRGTLAHAAQIAEITKKLRSLRWHMNAVSFGTRAGSDSIIFFPARMEHAAVALERTLPFPVRMQIARRHGIRLLLASSPSQLSFNRTKTGENFTKKEKAV